MRVQATLEFDLPFGDILLLGLVAYIQIWDQLCILISFWVLRKP